MKFCSTFVVILATCVLSTLETTHGQAIESSDIEQVSSSLDTELADLPGPFTVTVKYDLSGR